MAEPAVARKNPCASCPYRQGVPSGVWDATEYAKLPQYDGEIHEQTSIAVFSCHQGQGDVCSGWLGHRKDPADLLAVRIGLIREVLDPSVLDYTTEIDLFATGQEAADHGLALIETPDENAISTIEKIVRKRSLTDNPIT